MTFSHTFFERNEMDPRPVGAMKVGTTVVTAGQYYLGSNGNLLRITQVTVCERFEDEEPVGVSTMVEYDNITSGGKIKVPASLFLTSLRNGEVEHLTPLSAEDFQSFVQRKLEASPTLDNVREAATDKPTISDAFKVVIGGGN